MVVWVLGLEVVDESGNISNEDFLVVYVDLPASRSSVLRSIGDTKSSMSSVIFTRRRAPPNSFRGGGGTQERHDHCPVTFKEEADARVRD